MSINAYLDDINRATRQIRYGVDRTLTAIEKVDGETRSRMSAVHQFNVYSGK